MEENRTDDTQKVKRSFSAWLGELREFMKGRFSLDEDKAQRDEVVASVSKGVEFRGVNLWVLIFATMIASLGLNVNSAAVIIGAMLISPIMGPIMGVGLALGINDFELLKKSLRNLALMFIVAIITSTVYFFISPLSSNSSELLARTVPTTYDVLIALFGGLAGIVAQTRQDRTSTVIPGVAIATALIPPLCTAGFGLATGQFRFFIGAFYLFFINSVFIALATYAMVRFLQYEKKVFIDKVRERTVKRLMMVITLVTFIPSVVIGFHMVRVSLFEAVADKYVSQVFNFPHTRVIECNKHYAQGKNPSQIELLLVGEPLGEEVIENARTQMRNFGLEEAELVVRAGQHGGQGRRGFAPEELSGAAGGEEPPDRRDVLAAETLPGDQRRGERHLARSGGHDGQHRGHFADQGHHLRRRGHARRYDARLRGDAPGFRASGRP